MTWPMLTLFTLAKTGKTHTCDVYIDTHMYTSEVYVCHFLFLAEVDKVKICLVTELYI